MTAKELVDLIFNMNTKNKDEWLELEKKVDEWSANATEEENDELAISGAGEMLSMVCNGIRYEREHKSS